MQMIEIPQEIVPINFEMNPASEDLIHGTELQDGMVVLLEEALFRKDPSIPLDEMRPYDILQLRTGQRWCEVSKLVRNGAILRFIGIYADGTKLSRMYNEAYDWFVKI